MPYQNLTRQQLRDQLKTRLGPQAATFYTDTELNYYIQEALRTWNSMTGYWKGNQTFVTNGQPWYVIQGTLKTLSATIRVIWRNKPLTPCSLWGLDSGRPYWQSETPSSATDVPSEPTLYGVGALNLIAIWPADSGSQLVIEGIAATPILTSDADFVNIGDEEISLVLDYAEHVSTFKEGGAEWESTAPLFQRFMQGAVARNGMLAKSSAYRKFLGGDENDAQSNPVRSAARAGAR